MEASLTRAATVSSSGMTSPSQHEKGEGATGTGEPAPLSSIQFCCWESSCGEHTLCLHPGEGISQVLSCTSKAEQDARCFPPFQNSLGSKPHCALGAGSRGPYSLYAARSLEAAHLVLTAPLSISAFLSASLHLCFPLCTPSPPTSLPSWRIGTSAHWSSFSL